MLMKSTGASPVFLQGTSGGQRGLAAIALSALWETGEMRFINASILRYCVAFAVVEVFSARSRAENGFHFVPDVIGQFNAMTEPREPMWPC